MVIENTLPSSKLLKLESSIDLVLYKKHLLA